MRTGVAYNEEEVRREWLQLLVTGGVDVRRCCGMVHYGFGNEALCAAPSRGRLSQSVWPVSLATESPLGNASRLFL